MKAHVRMVGIAALALFLPVAAAAQSAPDTARCINAINKTTRKVTLATSKVINSCISQYASGLLAPHTVAQCMGSAPGVVNAIQKSLIAADNSCDGLPPAFGPHSISLHGPRGVQLYQDFLKDLFGAVPETALATSPSVYSCQAAVLKAAGKCEDLRLNSFNSCKKEGLKRGFVDSAVHLQTSCLGSGSTQPDPTGGKIVSTCVGGTQKRVDSSCVGQGVDLAAAFPGCNATTSAGLASCVDARLKCRLCNLLNDVDGLERDCDFFDDGDDSNESCAEPPECGDADVDPSEGCDDGGNLPGDGCSPLCTVEPGWHCSGEPSTCAPTCGDGIVAGNEACDDGGTQSGDGCSATCQVESGFGCVGAPSVCTTVCGDGIIKPGEACDDGGILPGDGCSPLCTLESGWQCSGQPSSCHTVCGDGLLRGSEGCDDGDLASGDGCSSACTTEVGWLCVGQPSLCTTVCGDGIIRPGETCDDGGLDPGDGCGPTCQKESGWQCAGQPSNCSTICGDGLLRGGEVCDDGDTSSGDGCSSACTIEQGYVCVGAPSICTSVCGDGVLAGTEACDDGGVLPGDGCGATCNVESGWTCSGEPSDCNTVCGDGLVRGTEACDDHNTTLGDGCNSSCNVEPGFFCSGQPSSCTQFSVSITSPVHGVFTTASSVNVTGVVSNLPPAQAQLTVNGVSVPVQPNGSFSTTVALSATNVFNPIRARVVDSVHGSAANARVVVIDSPSIADGSLSPQSVALRVTDTGLDDVEPLIQTLAGGGLNLGDLVPVGTVLVNNVCEVDGGFLGCLGRATVTINNPPPSFDSFTLAADSQTNQVAANITVNDIRVNVFLSGSGLVPSCDIAIHANAAHFNGLYNLQPSGVDPENIDVVQIGNLAVSFDAFTASYGGTCDLPIVGSIIQSFLPNLQDLTINAIQGYLNDPDGAGPQDGPIADAIETALGGISIAGPLGGALGVQFAAPLFAINEDVNGITFGSDSKFTKSVGTGVGQCQPPAGAPDFTASVAVNEVFPTFGATTPILHQPYGVAIAISSEGFNQLLKAQTECGLLTTSLTSLDLGTGTVPLTAGVLSIIMPEFGVYPPNTPFRIDVRPTIAPIIRATAGPGGELAIMKLSQILVSIVKNDASQQLVLRGAVDATVPIDIAFASGGVVFDLGTPAPGAITVAVLSNLLGVNETSLEQDVLPPLVATLLPSLASSLASFPLPSFLGLDLSGVEIARQGEFFSLYVNLVP